MQKTVRHLTILPSVLLSLTFSASAAPLVDYVFGELSPINLHTIAPEAGSVAGDMSADNMFDNVSAGSNTGFSSSSDTYFARASETSADLTTALANGEFVTFSVEPDAGFSLNLDSLDFSLGASAAATNYTVNVALYTSTDGFASNSVFVETFTQTFASTNSSNDYGFTAKNADLSSALYDNISGQLDFRFYVWDSNNDGSNYILRMEEFTLNGAVVAIPEPAGAALLLGGLGVLAIRRRCRV